MFHTHKWIEIKRKYTEPKHYIKNFKFSYDGSGLNTFEKDMYGFTIIELKCEKCGCSKFFDELGDLT